MAILLSELQQRTGTTWLFQLDGTVNCSFREGFITPARLDHLDIVSLVEMLAQSLLDWDILDGDGRPLVPKELTRADSSQPLTPEAIEQHRIEQWRTILNDIPISLLWEVFDGIMTAIRMRSRNNTSTATPLAA